VQRYFNALKKDLTYSPLLIPPDFTCDFLLYLAVSGSTIGMVLVQEDDMLVEHEIYYLSHGLVDAELQYSYFEKLSLEVVRDVKRLQHYILLRKTIVIVDFNSF
jgi:hypothetical protein